jgi:serine/threonine protein kinase
MEYLSGTTLRQQIAEEGALPLSETIDIAKQVAEGLSTIHAAGLIHRDVKPANILRTKEGIVKILDFGLATSAATPQPTGQESVTGTLAYTSPEQLLGMQVDARADVWALGVLCYEMLAGHVPFRGPNMMATIQAILTEPPASLREQRSEIPEKIGSSRSFSVPFTKTRTGVTRVPMSWAALCRTWDRRRRRSLNGWPLPIRELV